MTRPMRYFVLALAVTPFLAWGVHRIAKELGFLDPPWNAEHEQRRTIIVALYAFLLLVSVFLFGFANDWPRVWAIFGIVNGIALIVFAGFGLAAVRKLWRLRHPEPPSATGPVDPAPL